MFEFLNPFRHYRAKKRARLEAEKQIAIRKAELAEAEREAKRRKEYADHLQDLQRVAKATRLHPVQSAPKPATRRMDAGEEYPPTYSTPESVTNLLNTISEQSRVTAFEQGCTDIGSSVSDCPSDSGSSTSSDGGSSCGSTD